MHGEENTISFLLQLKITFRSLCLPSLCIPLGYTGFVSLLPSCSVPTWGQLLQHTVGYEPDTAISQAESSCPTQVVFPGRICLHVCDQGQYPPLFQLLPSLPWLMVAGSAQARLTPERLIDPVTSQRAGVLSYGSACLETVSPHPAEEEEALGQPRSQVYCLTHVCSLLQVALNNPGVSPQRQGHAGQHSLRVCIFILELTRISFPRVRPWKATLLESHMPESGGLGSWLDAQFEVVGHVRQWGNPSNGGHSMSGRGKAALSPASRMTSETGVLITLGSFLSRLYSHRGKIPQGERWCLLDVAEFKSIYQASAGLFFTSTLGLFSQPEAAECSCANCNLSSSTLTGSYGYFCKLCTGA